MPPRSNQEMRRAAWSLAITILTLFLIVTLVLGAALVGPAIIQTSSKSRSAHSSGHPAALLTTTTHRGTGSVS